MYAPFEGQSTWFDVRYEQQKNENSRPLFVVIMARIILSAISSGLLLILMTLDHGSIAMIVRLN